MIKIRSQVASWVIWTQMKRYNNNNHAFKKYTSTLLNFDHKRLPQLLQSELLCIMKYPPIRRLSNDKRDAINYIKILWANSEECESFSALVLVAQCAKKMNKNKKGKLQQKFQRYQSVRQPVSQSVNQTNKREFWQNMQSTRDAKCEKYFNLTQIHLKMPTGKK